MPDAPRPWPSEVAHALATANFAEATALLVQLTRRDAPPAGPATAPGASAARRPVGVLRPAAAGGHAAGPSVSARPPGRAARTAGRAGVLAQGGVTTCPARRRPAAALAAELVTEATARFDVELLRRFADKPAFDAAVLDEALGEIVVPFGERTASKSSVQLPRGSTVKLSTQQQLRLFIHWCEPGGGESARTSICRSASSIRHGICAAPARTTR
ncbi:MAG: hypothetical protein IPI49_15585 [Myxococcales bacterium]|nr:hypothetical protein [Myxococcales bacterium]